MGVLQTKLGNMFKYSCELEEVKEFARSLVTKKNDEWVQEIVKTDDLMKTEEHDIEPKL